MRSREFGKINEEQYNAMKVVIDKLLPTTTRSVLAEALHIGTTTVSRIAHSADYAEYSAVPRPSYYSAEQTPPPQPMVTFNVDDRERLALCIHLLLCICEAWSIDTGLTREIDLAKLEEAER